MPPTRNPRLVRDPKLPISGHAAGIPEVRVDPLCPWLGIWGFQWRKRPLDIRCLGEGFCVWYGIHFQFLVQQSITSRHLHMLQRYLRRLRIKPSKLVQLSTVCVTVLKGHV